MSGLPTAVSLDVKIIFEPGSEFISHMQIQLSPGSIWKPGYFEFHHVLAAHFWLAIPVEEAIARYSANQPQLIQGTHRAYMQSKYPGWPHQYIEPKHRPGGAQQPAEKIDASHLNVGDLDL